MLKRETHDKHFAIELLSSQMSLWYGPACFQSNISRQTLQSSHWVGKLQTITTHNEAWGAFTGIHWGGFRCIKASTELRIACSVRTAPWQSPTALEHPTCNEIMVRRLLLSNTAQGTSIICNFKYSYEWNGQTMSNVSIKITVWNVRIKTRQQAFSTASKKRTQRTAWLRSSKKLL